MVQNITPTKLSQRYINGIKQCQCDLNYHIIRAVIVGSNFSHKLAVQNRDKVKSTTCTCIYIMYVYVHVGDTHKERSNRTSGTKEAVKS